MLISIRKLLSKYGVNPENTPYMDILDYPINMGDFFAIEKIDAYQSDFAVFRSYESAFAQASADLRGKIAAITEAVKIAKENEKTDDMKKFRTEKKLITDAFDSKKREFYESKPEKYILTYKNILTADTFQNIAEFVPALHGACYGRLREMPLFTRNLKNLTERDSDNLGIEGGPCLFGTDEVIVEITHRDGGKYYYDFNTGNNYNNGAGASKVGMGEHFINFAEQISSVYFNNKKTKITQQEYESLAYPMELAALLGASFVFPIPDMSYKKYLESISIGMDPVIRTAMMEDFTRESHYISDMFLSLYNDLLKIYKPKRSLVLHERDSAALKLFYEKREKYFGKYKSNHHFFTDIVGKEESLYDYISFIAAPYYFWGTKNILQVDSVDEADCVRKCAKAHGKEIMFHSILFPEMISKNGTDTIFNAKEEYKIYV